MKVDLTDAGPRAKALIERDQSLLSPSYTREYPLVVEKALGSEVWDVDGRRYVDFTSGIAVLNVGHRHPAVVEAVREQLDKFWHICLSDFYYPVAVELAEKLQRIAPMVDAVTYFGNSGTEAVEAAIKLAMYKTGRKRFIGFIGSFHGRTLGSLSFTSSKYVQQSRFQSSIPVTHIPYPNAYRPLLAGANGRSYGDVVIDYLEETIFSQLLAPQDVAAVLVEPIQGEGGYVVPAPNFFVRLRELCDRHGILMIADEIQTGIGRTGAWWGLEHEGVTPDIICFAKGVASGMPLGGIVASKSLMDWQPGSHGSTFGGNPVAVAAALATLNVIDDENLLAASEQKGQQVTDALVELQSRHESIGEVRGRGLMVGMEIVKNRQTKERAVELRNALIQESFRRGLMLLPCGRNTLRVIPPLNVPDALLDEGLQTLAGVFADVEPRYL